MYVTVTASRTYSPLISYPGFTYPNPLTAQSVTRVQ